MSEYVSSAQSNQVVIQSDGKNRAKWGWVFALVWNAFVFSLIYFQGHEFLKIFKEDPVFWVFVLFPIVGAFLLYSSVTDLINWFRFGEAPLTLNNSPVYIGGNMSGFIDINTPFVSDMKAEVSLSCSHYYIDDSEDGTATEVLWQDDLLMPCHSHGDKTRVLFSFPIEEGLPQSQGKKSDRERHEWNLVVKLPVKGKDLERSYIVSVDKYYPMSGDNIEQSVPRNLDVAQSVMPASMSVGREAKLSAEYSEQSKSSNTSGTQYAKKKIPQISNTHTGIRYYYPAARHRVMGIILLAFGLFFGGMTFSMLNAFSDFLQMTSLLFSIPFILVATLMFLFGLLALLHRLEVVVGRSGISVSHKVLFYSYKGSLKPNEIADIKISRAGSSSGGSGGKSTVWYRLKLIDTDGMETSVGDGLSGSSFAKHIRQEMVDGLGSGWKPKEVVEKPGKVEKIKALKMSPYLSWLQKLIPLLFVLAIAYDLYYTFGPD